MGFFTDLKEDLSQAVSELMPDETIAAADPIKPEAAGEQGESLDSMLERLDSIGFPEGLLEEEASVMEDSMEEDHSMEEVHSLEEDFGLMPEDAGEMEEEHSMEGYSTEEHSMEKGHAIEEGYSIDEPTMKEEYSMEDERSTEERHSMEDDMDLERMLENALSSGHIKNESPIREEEKEEKKSMETIVNKSVADETAVITAGMTITGDVVSQGSMDLIGVINGNIEIMGKLNITGHINGNSKAAEIFADSAKINGEVVSEGSVKIGASSVIIGNITAISAVIAGAVKGDIDVRGPVILDTSAIVMGNIKSKSVQINNGAVIEGNCSQCYADVSPTNFFDDYKPDFKSVRK